MFVEGFVGKDRGYRSLSFQASDRLTLDEVPTTTDAESAEERKLLLDEAGRPIGWAGLREDKAPVPLGSTFDPGTDTLRVALDAALTSPAGLAVAVRDGRYAGVVDPEAAPAQLAEHRTLEAQGSLEEAGPAEAAP